MCFCLEGSFIPWKVLKTAPTLKSIRRKVGSGQRVEELANRTMWGWSLHRVHSATVQITALTLAMKNCRICKDA